VHVSGRQLRLATSCLRGLGHRLLIVVMGFDNSGASRPPRVYTASMLYRLRCLATRPPPTELSILSALGILHYRGCRGGRKLQRVIQVDSGRRRMCTSEEIHSRSSLSQHQSVRCRVVVSCTAPPPTLVSLMPPTVRPATAGFDVPPTPLVLNPTSLAKPHTLPSLHADMLSIGVEVALVSETWFQLHHSTTFTDLPGYVAYRLNRRRRRGGVVAVYVTTGIPTQLCPDLHNDAYKLLWVKARFSGRPLYICALYHPHKTSYADSDLLAYIDSCLDKIKSQCSSSVVIISGDFYQLSDNNVLSLGLLSLVSQPTHKGHCLDRIHCTKPLYRNIIKVFNSAIKTAHSMILARSDSSFIIDIRNPRTVLSLTRSSAKRTIITASA